MPRPTYGDPHGPGPERVSAHSSAISEDRRDNARELRAEMSLPEVLLWKHLRARRCGGQKFRRQHAIGPFVADFYCHELRLVVEIDSVWHAGREERDRQRDAWLRGQGFSSIRLQARDVLKNPGGAAAGLAQWMEREFGPAATPVTEEREEEQ